MSETLVSRCDCNDSYQNGRYGRMMRLHNVTKDRQKKTCTICNKETNTGMNKPSDKEKKATKK